MAYSVNWSTKVITIPRTDMTLLQASPEIRGLPVTELWQKLIDIQDGEEGIAYLDIVSNTPPKTIAGITLGRVVEIINGYTITFQDGQYAVNVTGGNSNVADVVNKNQVSVNTANSAGFIQGSDDVRIGEIYKLLGLDAANPLAVTSTSRVSGSIQQTITEAGGTVTVRRQ